MKKLLCMLLAMVILFISAPVFAEQNPIVKVDGQIVYFPDAQPFIDNNSRTMVPVRFVAETLGADVDFEETRQLVTIIKDTTRIALIIGENSAIVNTPTSDTKKTFDTVSILKEDRTFVPLRFVSETFGAGVAWDSKNNTVVIRSDGTVEQFEQPIIPIPQSTSLYKKTANQVLAGVTEDEINANPIMQKLALMDGCVSISKENDMVYGFSYNEIYVMDNGRIETLPSSYINYSFNPKSPVIFSASIYKNNASTLARFKNQIDLLNPIFKDELYKMVLDNMGGKGSGYSGVYKENYVLSIKQTITSNYKPEEQGASVMFVKYK